MADLKTAITEIVTGLGMCGTAGVEPALATRPAALQNVDDETWCRLLDAYADGVHRDLFVASWMNGNAFLRSRDALRDRVPVNVEWKGAHRSIGDEAVPTDLRVDHVYLVSCKYLSDIVLNASPQHLFERLLAGGHGKRTGIDWYEEVAPAEHAALYETVRASVDLELPERVSDLTVEQRRELGHSYERGSAWPGDGERRYAALGRAGRHRIGPALARRDRTRTRSDVVAVAADRQRALLRARRVTEGVHAAPHRVTVGLAPALRAPQVHGRAARRRPADGVVGGDRPAPVERCRHGRTRLRGDPLEPPEVRRAAGSEGPPRDAARRGAGLLRPRVDRAGPRSHRGPHADQRRE